jgi:hypothetical protein
MLSVETTGLFLLQFLWLWAVETSQFEERSVYQRGEDRTFVGAASNQQSGIRNRLVLHLRGFTAVSMKCACHEKYIIIIQCVIFNYITIHFIRYPKM